jgi:hypothetical protein
LQGRGPQASLHPLGVAIEGRMALCIEFDSFSNLSLGKPATLLNQPESQQPGPPRKSIFKKPSFYSKIVFTIAALIVFWIFFSRWWQNRAIEYRAKDAAAAKQRADDRATLEQMGGKELAIQTFYASPGEIRRGQSVQLCYGVANAKSVKLEPQSNPVWPSYSRCVNDSPAKTTTYTLTIADAAGNTKSQSLTVQVR